MSTSETVFREHDGFVPSLSRYERNGIVVHADASLRDATGILVAFTERSGGVSVGPYTSLDLAAHVGDDPDAVDANRDRLFTALGLEGLRDRLVTAEQVHGSHIEPVTPARSGAGAMAAGGDPAVPSTDALMTCDPELPLMMFFADCVPVILVAPEPQRAVAVVHAGWRGTLASLPGMASTALASHAGSTPSRLLAYIGPHIGACCYEVDDEILSHFCNNFDTIGAVGGRLDLAAAVRESLMRSGLASERIAELGVCTRDHTDRFFSYRASSTTGRHGALAVITEGE